jgi:hypothetical protein
MSRIISGSIWGLALAAIAAFSAMPVSAASSGAGGANSPHVLLVHGGGGGGHGGGGFGGGGFGGGGGHSFSGGSAHAFSGASPAISGNSHAFSGNAGNFASGSHSSFSHGGIGSDGFSHGGWNHGDWAWHGNHFYGGWWGFGYPLGLWLGGYGWWYPGYYGYDDGPYYSYGDNYAYADNGTVPQQSYTALEPQQPNSQTGEEGQGNEYLEEGIRSFQGGDYRNAMRMAEHAIVDSPRDAEAHEVVSLAAFANKDYRTAATEAHAVIALGGVPSWNQVYAIYQNADAYTSQLRALEDYVKEHPKSPEGQFLLGVQYLTTGYASEAHDHLAKAAELAPKDKILQDLLKGGGSEAPTTANRPDSAETK